MSAPSRLDDLLQLREVLWASIKEADADKRAPLAARLESVVKQIAELSADRKQGDPIDEIAARRAARGASPAKVQRRAEGKK